MTSRVEILEKENEMLKEDKKKLAKHFGERNAKKKVLLQCNGYCFFFLVTFSCV